MPNHCTHCNHAWESRLPDGRRAARCPRCQSVHWDRPRQACPNCQEIALALKALLDSYTGDDEQAVEAARETIAKFGG